MGFFLIMVNISIVLLAGFISIRVSDPYKALSAFSVLFLLSPINTRVLFKYLFFEVLLAAGIISVFSLHNFSNHFLVSLDIIFLFSVLLLVLFHSLKIQRKPSVR